MLVLGRQPHTFARADAEPPAPLAIQPLDLLAVDGDAIPAKQNMQPTIAEPPALLHQFGQSQPQAGMIDTAYACDLPELPARPPPAHPQRCLEMRGCLALRSRLYHFLQLVFQPRIVPHGVHQQSLGPGVVFFERRQSRRVRNLETANLTLPRVIGCTRHALAAVKVGHHSARFGVLQNARGLFFQKLLPLHRPSLRRATLYL